jgi:hypothetical protein
MSAHNRTRKMLFKLFGARKLKGIPARTGTRANPHHPLRDYIKQRKDTLALLK